MPFLRKIVFYLFLAIYGIICPMLILRLLGFVFDPVTKHWVKTGIIYVSSNPPEASVYINGRLAQERTPTVIRDLTPGDYAVRMQLDGYTPWENMVPVVDKKATSIENILLIPTRWDKKRAQTQPAGNLIGIPGSSCLLSTNGDSVNNILILHLNDNDAPEPLFPKESIYRESRLIHYFTVAQSPFIVLQIELNAKQKYLWIDTRDKQIHIEDISDLITTPPQRLFWEPNDDKNLFAVYPEGVNRINIKAKAIYPNIEEKNIPVPKRKTDQIEPPRGDQVFFINNDNTFLYRDGNEVFLMDALPKTQARLSRILLIKPGTDIFFHEKNGQIYFIDSSNTLMTMTVLHHKPFIPKPIAETLRLKRLEE